MQISASYGIVAPNQDLFVGVKSHCLLEQPRHVIGLVNLSTPVCTRCRSAEDINKHKDSHNVMLHHEHLMPQQRTVNSS